MSDVSPTDDPARAIWLVMSDLVLDHMRRRAVSDALNMSFGRARALRCIAKRPRSMRELAQALDIDPTNATTVVDQLVKAGLVVRLPHPTDRRAKLIDVTDEGRTLAATANEILATPPAALSEMAPADLQTLERLLSRLETPPRDR